MSALRSDKLEKIYAYYKSQRRGPIYTQILLSVDQEDNQKSFNLGKNSSSTIFFPKPKNIMIFCMGAIADDSNGNIPRLSKGKYSFDKRFQNFGDNVLIITNPVEFSSRINSAQLKEENAFSSPFIEDGYGLVDYVNLSNYSGNIGLFKKDIAYSWQQEFRFSFGIKSSSLNKYGAYEFQIGDIQNISEIVNLKDLIDEPLKIKKTTLNISN